MYFNDMRAYPPYYEVYLKTLRGDKWEYACAEIKWSMKKTVRHIPDGERIIPLSGAVNCSR